MVCALGFMASTIPPLKRVWFNAINLDYPEIKFSEPHLLSKDKSDSYSKVLPSTVEACEVWSAYCPTHPWERLGASGLQCPLS